MDAEALIGKVLGTCTLQQLIGQGGMGAVFLAQQSRPRRQVAVKVLLPMTPLASNQRAAFLERFQRETDAAASLVHPNIMPVHEYGEQDGLAYLVMPYVSGGTLRDVLESEQPLPLTKVMNYLEQMAAALDIAHERGVIHRDIKPANILLTPEGRLLLTDFGLVKIVSEGQSAQNRLTGVGVPMGTPDYMAPEQVMGGEIDARADLYSLGVILYQMVTGSVPFKGEMPMQVVLQHLHSAPPSPRVLCPDLPISAEHVMLRALAKNPADRYMSAQDLASAFRLIISASGTLTSDISGGAFPPGQTARFKPRGLFDPMWQGGTPAAPTTSNVQSTLSSHKTKLARPNDLVAKTSMTMPSFSGFEPPRSLSPATPGIPPFSPPFGKETRHLAPSTPPSVDGTQFSMPQGMTSPAPGLSSSATAGNTPFPASSPETKVTNVGSMFQRFTPLYSPAEDVSTSGQSGQALSSGNAQASLETATSEDRQSAEKLEGLAPGIFPSVSNTRVLAPLNTVTETTGPLLIPSDDGESGTSGTMKLTQSVKVVKVAIAGQPGRYMTGFLPMLPPTPEAVAPPEPAKKPTSILQKKMQLIALVTAILLVIGGSVSFFVTRGHSAQQAKQASSAQATPNLTAIAAQQATATAQANIILEDALSQNAHNWPSEPKSVGFVFKDGAYHISGNDTHTQALLPDEVFSQPFRYTLTMQEVNGDDNNINNWFGMILRYTTHGQNKTFYCFEVLNKQGGEYRFLKFDNSFGADIDPWTSLWSQPFGGEYHMGHGPKSQNTLQVVANGPKFTFIVNGKQVGTAQDSSLSGGQIGMLVNLKGTEVAFSNLVLAYN